MDANLANAIRYAAQQGMKQIEIKLSPENLGSLTIKVTQGIDGSLQVVLHASNAKAANLLTQHLDGLNTACRATDRPRSMWRSSAMRTASSLSTSRPIPTDTTSSSNSSTSTGRRSSPTTAISFRSCAWACSDWMTSFKNLRR